MQLIIPHTPSHRICLRIQEIDVKGNSLHLMVQNFAELESLVLSNLNYTLKPIQDGGYKVDIIGIDAFTVTC